MSIKYANADILSVQNASNLFTLKNLIDNQLVQTQGYITEGVGANLYRYDSGSSATIDGGFTLPGIGGTLSFSGTTFNGTAGTGRFVAVDQTVADLKKFGALGDNVDDTNAVARWFYALNICKVLYAPVGTYKCTSAMQVPSVNEYSISGAGNRTIFIYTPTDGSAFLDLNGTYGAHLSSFRISGQSAYQNCVCIDFNYANRYSLIKVECYNAAIGIDFSYAFTGQLFNVVIRYCNLAFNAFQMNNVNGRIVTENCKQTCILDSTYELDLFLMNEGEPRQTSSTLNNLWNSRIQVYHEDFQNTKREVPEWTIGNTAHCFNLELLMYASNSTGLTDTVTVDAGTDVFTATAHGLSDGDYVYFTTTGSLPTGLITTRNYYVINSATDTFQVSHSLGGPAVDITSTGTGVHSVETINATEFIALDDVDGIEIKGAIQMGRAKNFVTTTADTRNVTFSAVDLTNAVQVYAALPATNISAPAINYWMDPFFENGLPSVTDFNTSHALDTSNKPSFAAASLKVTSSIGAASNIAYRTILFADYPHLYELRGKTIGVAWWQYVDPAANYVSGGSGWGPTVRVVPNGTSPTSSEFKDQYLIKGMWHSQVSYAYVPTDATQIIVYYYSNQSAASSDASMECSFVGPVLWVGGLANCQQVLNGKFSHHPAAIPLSRIRLSSGAIFTSSSGSPEGVVTAPIGSMYTRTDGAASTTLYIKESGTGNTGWNPK